MTYEDALAWLYSTQTFGIKLGLENIRRLLKETGVPLDGHEGPPYVFHVAGTNGKGSVCAMIDSICRAAGLRTVLFTSPHLLSFRERIRLDGVEISEADAAAGLARIRNLVADWDAHPTFFEIATALGLAWFYERNAEAIVLETGLGGRLDSTNAVTPAVSVLTPIGFDHCLLLGDTLEKIAGEKAGIVKPGVPVVISPQPAEAARVFQETAARLGSPAVWVSEPASFEVALRGSHQKINAAIAIEALRAARAPVSLAAIERGLREVVWPARFQSLPGFGFPAILDGAHNEPAIRQLVQTWREIYGEARPVVLLGVLRDKDVSAICRELAPLAAEFVVAPLESARTCSAESLAETVRNDAPQTPCALSRSVAEALRLAESRARELGKPLLITGSLFLAGEILALQRGSKPETSAQ